MSVRDIQRNNRAADTVRTDTTRADANMRADVSLPAGVAAGAQARSVRTTARADASAIADTVDQVIQNRAAMLEARLDAAAPAPRTTQRAAELRGAQSFATSLDSMRGFESADQATAEFMKIESQGMATNQRTEGLLNRARSILREMAFKLDSALAGRADQLRSEAQQAEDRAVSMSRDALASIGVGDEPNIEGGPQFTRTSAEFTRDLWTGLVQGADAYATEAARLRIAAEQARREGNTEAMRQAIAKAEEYEGKMEAIFSQVGIPMTGAMIREMETIAAERAQAGQTGGVFATYLTRHPEQARAVLDPAAYDQAMRSSNPGQALIQALIDKSVSSPADEDGGGPRDALAAGIVAASEGGDVAMLNSGLASQYPNLPAAMPQLAGAAEAIIEAESAWARANVALAAQWDARQAIGYARSAESTHGVAERNARGQHEVLRSLAAMTDGARLDLDLRDQAARVASEERQSVSRLLLEAVERSSESSGAQRRVVRS